MSIGSIALGAVLAIGAIPYGMEVAILWRFNTPGATPVTYGNHKSAGGQGAGEEEHVVQVQVSMNEAYPVCVLQPLRDLHKQRCPWLTCNGSIVGVWTGASCWGA
jgi:hypothetical protein